MFTKTYASVDSMPPFPRLVFRVGFAGRQSLTDTEATLLRSALKEIFNQIAGQLIEIAPGIPLGPATDSRVSRYYSDACPLLRLVTGLCQGADDLAAEVLSELPIQPQVPLASDHPPAVRDKPIWLQTELGAILPFSPADYRASRPESFRRQFDRRLAACAWVIALDGIYDKPTDEQLGALDETQRRLRKSLADNRRARAYRAQAAYLLRQSDLIIAAANPDDPGKAGGTLETIRNSLEFDLPVLLIHTGKERIEEAIYLITPDDDLPTVLASPPSDPEGWRLQLADLIRQIVADPDIDRMFETYHDAKPPEHDDVFLRQYFRDRTLPPLNCAGKRKRSIREGVAEWFFDRFGRRSKLPSDQPLPPLHTADTPKPSICKRVADWLFSLIGQESKPAVNLSRIDIYRNRATALNYHYSGLYRGAFLLNYILAILAVILGAVSLTLLAIYPRITTIQDAWIPLVLGGSKLVILCWIVRNTRRGNKGEWNDLSIDTRYLAERLRGMYYLPPAGSYQPPVAAPPRFASRVVRQSAADWLFDAIVRSASPAELPSAQPNRLVLGDGAPAVRIRNLYTPDAGAILQTLREKWVAPQVAYHDKVRTKMGGVNRSLVFWSKWLGWAVILVVACELFFIDAKLTDRQWLEMVLPARPWLILGVAILPAIAAILPAVVAAMGGIRFQSECQRLAERSAVMRVMLAGRANAKPGERRGRTEEIEKLEQRIRDARAQQETDLGSWCHGALRMTERVAGDFVAEAAEWSVLYSKEITEPS
ncbi:MAG: hypothetical protein EA381_00025 [Planctomycetaceae bacterium]|nr:MAG: hypothetical protein EA381_00025 [Planctomycetaceae bacterium]